MFRKPRQSSAKAPPEPWLLVYDHYDAEEEGQREVLCALDNVQLGFRDQVTSLNPGQKLRFWLDEAT